MTAIGCVSTDGDDGLGDDARAAENAAGNPVQRVLAGVIARAFELADGLGEARGYAAALGGLDALESLCSAVEAAQARLIVEAHAHAHEMLARDDLTPGQRRTRPDGSTESVLSRSQITAIDVATTLKVSTGCAAAKVDDALRLVRHLPRTLARLEDGTLTGYQATYRIVRACTDLTADQLAAFDEQLCDRSFTPGKASGPGAHRARTTNVGRWVDAARTAAGAATETTNTRRSGFAGRRLDFGQTGPDGMTALFASMPAAYASALDRLLTDLARANARPDDSRTETQRKLDAFLTLFTGPIALFSDTAPDQPAATSPEWDEDGHYVLIDDEDQYTEARIAWEAIKTLAASIDLTLPDLPPAAITLDVPLDALIDAHQPWATGATSDGDEPADRLSGRPRSDRSPSEWTPDQPHGEPPGERPRGELSCGRPVRLRGVGEVPVGLATRLLPYADLQRIITDPLTGQPLDVGRRQPSQRLRTAIAARDGTCRFPGCARPVSATTDLDHLQPWRDDQPPIGQTVPQNLHVLCRRHHRAKHQLHWQPEMLETGHIQWTNPITGTTDLT